MDAVFFMESAGLNCFLTTALGNKMMHAKVSNCACQQHDVGGTFPFLGFCAGPRRIPAPPFR